ncbi:rod shape-determining protein MreD [Gallibacterium anatis]|uniref:rod shape-determining protein MreD n=1 Tax=Gallibacterium anatis TaxID=750 RepID=UPI000531BD16|nr:rod shape-determining protein MreD [Gallibacterium anatis]KGQ53254.1 rod shape-determining protein MreD [Gallibacterium anatis]KGQ60620.1 rod shape-determining protein MreD [Gallibacterium anatis]KGQ68326.1 rod shape-determining protein MreD [Gallibacterium anatis]
MKANVLFQWLMIALTFVIAFVLEIMPWPAEFRGYRPAWVVLVLLYWVMAIPNRVNIGIAFLIGLVWDLILGSILGIHTLVLSIFAYLIAVNSMILRNLSLWQQSLLVILFVFLIRCSIFLLALFLHSAIFNSQEFIGAVLSGILWPWLFLILRGLRRKLALR